MHSGKAQEARQATLDSFKAGETHVRIGTDVVGRGIDIPDVVQVINYDTPKNIEDYTHRIGRTGRAGKAGLATTLLTMEDSHIFYDLKQLLMNAKQVVSGEWVSHPAANTKQGADGKKMQKIDR
jgi:ATP-dependent RNA helicase DDX23/PRP28